MNTELEQFAYAAAHDLQEPLRNVALAAQLLKRNGDSAVLTYEKSEQEPPLLSLMLDNALRMEAMVKDLLAYSRALEGVEDSVTASDANKVLETALRNLAAAQAEKSAIITKDLLPRVSMAEPHLLQLFQNLISNALKYAARSPLQIHVGAKIRSGDVLLFVKDNGVGISPQFHERAFGMFKRLDRESANGTGIGLAVCKRIVEHYGGHIWIESQVGEGATFFFNVPSASGN
jgi:light-regulated signal transduction histidine kinase (bacteriophytochrome)